MRRSVNHSVNRKGNTLDVIFISIVIFVFMIVSVIAISFYQDIQTELTDEFLTTNESKAAMDTTVDGLPIWIDSAVLFILVGLLIFIIVSAFFIDSHPIFLVLGFIVMIAFGVVWIGMQEVGEDIFGSEEAFTNTTADMPITSFLMNNFFKIFLAVPFLVLIVLYAKGKLNQGGGLGGGGVGGL